MHLDFSFSQYGVPNVGATAEPGESSLVDGLISVPETLGSQAKSKAPTKKSLPPPQTHSKPSGCQSNSSDSITPWKGELGPDISEARTGRQKAHGAGPRGDPDVPSAWLIVVDH